MSASWIRAKPSMADPSNPSPSVRTGSNSWAVMVIDLRKPRTSVNHSRMNLIPRSSTVRRTNSASLDSVKVPSSSFAPSSVRLGLCRNVTGELIPLRLARHHLSLVVAVAPGGEGEGAVVRVPAVQIPTGDVEHGAKASCLLSPRRARGCVRSCREASLLLTRTAWHVRLDPERASLRGHECSVDDCILGRAVVAHHEWFVAALEEGLVWPERSRVAIGEVGSDVSRFDDHHHEPRVVMPAREPSGVVGDGHHLLVDGSLRLQLDPVEIRMHGVRQCRPMAKDRLVEPSARTAEGGGGDDSRYRGSDHGSYQPFPLAAHLVPLCRAFHGNLELCAPSSMDLHVVCDRRASGITSPDRPHGHWCQRPPGLPRAEATRGHSHGRPEGERTDR